MLRKELGDRGEQLARRYLKKQGYKILDTNFSCRTGEIDIIAHDNHVIVFVEVRSKSDVCHGLPSETIDQRKQQRIRSAAQHYLMSQGKLEAYCRFDVISIIWQTPEPILTLYRDAF